MEVIELANKLGEEIKQSQEFREFKEIKDRVYSNPELKAKIDEFEKMRYNEQILAIQKENQNQEGIQKLQEIYQLLMQNEVIKEYFEKQVRFNVMIADVNKIIGNAIKELL